MLISLALALLPRSAEAQPCCAGSSALTPARLAIHEIALVGLQTRATYIYGSFDAARHFVPASPGAREVDLEEDLVGSVRFHRAQASLLFPVDETMRHVPGTTEWGGGVGDIQLSLRYDFVDAGAYKRIPGLALLGALTFPSGRPADVTSTPLATGATGNGAFQAALGASVEQSFGPVLLNVTGSAAWRAWRHVESIRSQDGVLFTSSAAAAYSFSSGLVLALSVSYAAALDGSIDHKRVEHGGTAQTRGGLSAGGMINDHWRAQGAVFSDLPVRYLGQNQPSGVGGSFMLIRSWF